MSLTTKYLLQPYNMYNYYHNTFCFTEILIKDWWGITSAGPMSTKQSQRFDLICSSRSEDVGMTSLNTRDTSAFRICTSDVAGLDAGDCGSFTSRR